MIFLWLYLAAGVVTLSVFNPKGLGETLGSIISILIWPVIVVVRLVLRRDNEHDNERRNQIGRDKKSRLRDDRGEL